MPDLPTITITQAQMDKCLTVFGATPALAIPVYKAWLTFTLREYVLSETQRIGDSANITAMSALLNTTRSQLP